MSGHIPVELAREVPSRADNTCEYCRLPQSSQEATFHVDHIHPRSAGGRTISNNLALACFTCSLRKAARVRVRDSRTGKTVRLFDPRKDDWHRHFRFTTTWRVRGRTSIGRVTAKALGMNREAIVAIRKELAALGWSPIE